MALERTWPVWELWREGLWRPGELFWITSPFFLRAVTHNVHSSWLSKGAFGGCLCILMYSWRGSRVIPLLLRPLYRSAREPSLVRRTHESEAAGAEVEKWARGEVFFYGNGVLTHAQHGTARAMDYCWKRKGKKSSARAHSCLLVPQSNPL